MNGPRASQRWGIALLHAGLSTGLLLLLAGGAAADAEIEHKLARLRALTRPTTRPLAQPMVGPADAASGSPAVGPAAPGAAACTPARARSSDAARAAVSRLRDIHDASLRYAVSADLIRSVIRHESAGNAAAVSHKGAVGLMQLMPTTARALGVACRYDPRQNVMGGTRYLRELRDRFGSWRRALAAYHAGPARVETGRLPTETLRYVERVLRSWRGS